MVGISSEIFVSDVKEPKHKFYCKNQAKIVEILTENISEGDYILFMGAGNISDIAYSVFDTLSKTHTTVFNHSKKIQQ